MKKLEAFTAKDLRSAERVMIALRANNLTEEQLSEFNKAHLPKPVPSEGLREEGKASTVSGRHQTRRRSANKPRRRGRAKAIDQLLKPGDSRLSDMLCGCGDKILLEGVCGGTAVKLGYIRLGTCIGCNKEFKIR